MSELKATPGPWLVVRASNGYPYTIKAPNGSSAKGAVGRQILRWGAFMLPSSEEAEANAHLIAAAPELYEALWDLLGACEIAAVMPEAIGKAWVPSMDAPELERARAVLAKAHGEQP